MVEWGVLRNYFVFQMMTSTSGVSCIKSINPPGLGSFDFLQLLERNLQS
jgi:hypothetical protein